MAQTRSQAKQHKKESIAVRKFMLEKSGFAKWLAHVAPTFREVGPFPLPTTPAGVTILLDVFKPQTPFETGFLFLVALLGLALQNVSAGR
jgi:hypothetical protein